MNTASIAPSSPITITALLDMSERDVTWILQWQDKTPATFEEADEILAHYLATAEMKTRADGKILDLISEGLQKARSFKAAIEFFRNALEKYSDSMLKRHEEYVNRLLALAKNRGHAQAVVNIIYWWGPYGIGSFGLGSRATDVELRVRGLNLLVDKTGGFDKLFEIWEKYDKGAEHVPVAFHDHLVAKARPAIEPLYHVGFEPLLELFLKLQKWEPFASEILSQLIDAATGVEQLRSLLAITEPAENSRGVSPFAERRSDIRKKIKDLERQRMAGLSGKEKLRAALSECTHPDVQNEIVTRLCGIWDAEIRDPDTSLETLMRVYQEMGGYEDTTNLAERMVNAITTREEAIAVYMLVRRSAPALARVIEYTDDFEGLWNMNQFPWHSAPALIFQWHQKLSRSATTFDQGLLLAKELMKRCNSGNQELQITAITQAAGLVENFNQAVELWGVVNVRETRHGNIPLRLIALKTLILLMPSGTESVLPSLLGCNCSSSSGHLTMEERHLIVSLLKERGLPVAAPKEEAAA